MHNVSFLPVSAYEIRFAPDQASLADDFPSQFLLTEAYLLSGDLSPVEPRDTKTLSVDAVQLAEDNGWQESLVYVAALAVDDAGQGGDLSAILVRQDLICLLQKWR